jgi:hypothetical protein
VAWSDATLPRRRDEQEIGPLCSIGAIVEQDAPLNQLACVVILPRRMSE